MNAGARIQEPRQARSAATLKRILDATETLLEDASFDNVSVQTIMERASVRPGSFYARFPHKRALLAVLYERYASDVEAILDRELPRLSGLGAEDRIRQIVHLVGRTYRTRRGVARSAALHYWNRAAEPPLLDDLARRNARILRHLRETFVTAVRDLPVDVSNDATTFALKLVLMSSREQYLFSHRVQTLRIPDTEFESRLSDMVIGYLKGGAR